MSARVTASGALDRRSVWQGWGWLPDAKALQRKGRTLTEIARLVGADRVDVVQALYWDVVDAKQ